MKTISDFVPALGLPVRQDEGHLIEEIAPAWPVSLPEDFVAITGTHGDAAISDYIYCCGARTLRRYADGMGRRLEASRTVPHTVLPNPGGALVWGNTVEGDQLFLFPREGGS
ncbi:hypothetical protein ACH4U5_09580 [Streptomyces sp. NPDC020858]|uniref:hypothetical protein n=1 Tax=Streptomyces sp. NPDC020858 TaxID=3365097 RepID=UPI0037983078